MSAGCSPFRANPRDALGRSDLTTLLSYPLFLDLFESLFYWIDLRRHGRQTGEPAVARVFGSRTKPSGFIRLYCRRYQPRKELSAVLPVSIVQFFRHFAPPVTHFSVPFANDWTPVKFRGYYPMHTIFHLHEDKFRFITPLLLYGLGCLPVS